MKRKSILLILFIGLLISSSTFSQSIKHEDDVYVALDVKDAMIRQKAKKIIGDPNLYSNQTILTSVMDSIKSAKYGTEIVPDYIPKYTSGYYLRKSARQEAGALGFAVVGGIATGILLSSKNNDVKTGSYIVGGITGLTSLGLYIAHIVAKNNAGKRLEYEIKSINAKIQVSDNGSGVKVSF